MIFFLELLSCGHSHLSQNTSLYLPELYLFSEQKNQNEKQKLSTKLTQNMSSTLSVSSQLLLQNDVDFQFSLPSSHFILCHQRYNQSIRNIDWGVLIGVVNANHNEINIMGNNQHCLKIGRNQEITSLRILRPYSLDHLVVIWKQHSQFRMDDLVSSPQRLMIVFEGERQLEPFLKLWQAQLLSKFGEFYLRQIQNLIQFNIITTQNKTILDFVDSFTFESSFSKLVKDMLGVQLNCEQRFLLLGKATLRDYINLKKQIPQINMKMNNYLIQIRLQLTPKEDYENDKSVSKDSCDSLILTQFFAKQYQQADQVNQQNMNDQDLMIFYFNTMNQDTIDEQIIPPKRKHNSFRKRRSKSSDSICIIDEHLDDQFFDKY